MNISKLQPRSVKVILLGYYDHEDYKLLEWSTGAVFRSRDVIFEEGTTNFTIQKNSKQFFETEDVFEHTQTQQSANIYEGKEDNRKQAVSQQAIAPQPWDITKLHKPTPESKNLDNNEIDMS